jgi:hypothetical protein
MDCPCPADYMAELYEYRDGPGGRLEARLKLPEDRG